MRRTASIKGIAFVRSHARLIELVEAGRIRRDELEARIPSSAVLLLEDKVEPSLWYPLDATESIRRILVEVDAAGLTPAEYQRQTGFEGALPLVKGTREGALAKFVEGARERTRNQGETLIQIGQLIFNFGTWHFESHGDETWTIVFEDGGLLPELTCYAAEGFIQALSSPSPEEPIQVTSQRPEASRIVFRGCPNHPPTGSFGASD